MIVGSINNLSFGRRPEIRRADDVQRAVRRTFPMLSSTYIDTFYSSSTEDSQFHERISKTSSKIDDKIQTGRLAADYPSSFNKGQWSEEEISTPYAITLNNIKKNKVGNCRESAEAAVAALCANGFLNSRRAELCMQVTFENEKTGEISEPVILPMDHSFALTDMNTDDELDIVVDPWLGFADSTEGAIDHFKKIYSESDFSLPVSIARYNYFLRKENSGQEYHIDDYKVHRKLIIRVLDDNYKDEDFEALGAYTSSHFSEALISDNPFLERKDDN